MNTRSKSDEDLQNTYIYDHIEEKEFCVECYTELHYYHMDS